MRNLSNLEKENTLLFVAGFSFADEHIADITRRAANTNPTLHVVVFAFNDEEGEKISANLKVSGSCLNNNITVLTPSGLKESNKDSQDSKCESFVDTVSQFDFETVNRLFELISGGIVTYGCK